jgi:SRSO17 transposase
VAASFAKFHQEFAPLFGRTEARARSEQYLRGLLVQQTDRRNAENLAETIDGATPRSLQRFLTESPWGDWPVIERLQSGVGQRLNQPAGVFVLDDTGFGKQGKKSVGVARQYSGTLGKVGNCQVGVFLAYVTAEGHALVDKALYLPREWTDDRQRCREAGVPEEIGYQTKAELGLGLLRRARQAGHLTTEWVTADSGYGEVPSLRDTLDTEGWRYVLEVPSNTHVFSQAAQVAVPVWSGRGRKPSQLQLVAGEPCSQNVQAVAASLLPADWHELTVAEGAQGPAFTSLPLCGSGKAGRACQGGPAGWSCGAIWTAARPSTTCPMRPQTPLCCVWRRLRPCAGRSRPSFRPRRAKPVSTSTRCALGWAGSITSPWPCWLELSC